MVDIRRANKAHAYRMLQCLAVAIRPLTVAELAELLAFDFNAAKGGIPKLNANWRWEDHEQAVLSTCSSLITIVPGDSSPVVQFSHFSVREFLLSDRIATSTEDLSRYHIILGDANTLIARACLGVLLRDPVDETGEGAAPLAKYAAKHWVAHARAENVASRVCGGMQNLFNSDKPYFSAWVKLHDVQDDLVTALWVVDSNVINKIQPAAVPLYYAAMCGFHEIVEHLALNYPQYSNSICGKGGTALHVASDEGHVQVVRSLLKCGVDVDSPGTLGMSPLQYASENGNVGIVRCLLDHGADPNFRDANQATPLCCAAISSHEIVRLLLERNVDVNARDKDGRTPLHHTFLYNDPKADYPKIVRLLLEHGANPNTRDNKHQTPLHLFSSNSFHPTSKLEAVRVLLAHGAEVDVEDKKGRTPSQVASENGKDEFVQLLSEYRSK